MVRDLIKFLIVVATFALVVGLIVLFATGYFSAFKPGGVVDRGKNVTGGGGVRSVAAGSVKLSSTNVTGPATPGGAPVAAQPENVQQQAGNEAQQAYAPPQSLMPALKPRNRPQSPGMQQQPGEAPEAGNASPEQPGMQLPPGEAPETGNIPTATPPESGGAGEQGNRQGTGVAPEPGTPDMYGYIAGWQAAIEQFFRMLPYIFSRQFGFLPSWPTWPSYTPNMKY